MKVRELKGVALDWAVAKSFGQGTYWTSEEFLADWSPSTKWNQAGPIIEREKIELIDNCGDPTDEGYWFANIRHTCGLAWGKTALEAAMRCYVMSKVGDEMEIPNNLYGV